MADQPDPLWDIIYKRGEILAAINDQPRTKPALTDSLEASRSTINRGVNELADAGCIERDQRKYRSTLLRDSVCKQYQRYRAGVEALENAREILQRLPHSATLPTTFLRGADAHPADAVTPETALEPSIELLADTNRMVGLAPVGLSLYVDLLYDYATTSGFSAEIIVQDDALQQILDLDEHRLRELSAEGDLDILVATESFQYALWLMESPETTTAGVTVYDDGGISGVLINDTSDAVNWAREEYERYRDAATQVRTADLFES